MKAQDAARNIINYCFSKQIYLCNLDLQKIMYLCALAYYKETGACLIADSEFFNRRTGPVIPSVYLSYKIFGIDPISKHLPADEPLPEFLYAVLDKLILKSPIELNVLCLFSQRHWNHQTCWNAWITEDMLKQAADVVSCF